MGKILFVLGKTGTGKTTFIRELVKLEGFCFYPQYTTRPKRDGEVDGEEYSFTTNKNLIDVINEYPHHIIDCICDSGTCYIWKKKKTSSVSAKIISSDQ